MRQRLISAAVLVPVVVIVFLAGQYVIWLAIASLAALAGYETARLVNGAGLRANLALSVVVPAAVVLLFPFAAIPAANFAFQSDNWLFIPPALALWLAAAAAVGLRAHDASEGFRTWLGTMFATVYPSLLAFTAGIAILGWQQPAGNLLGRTFDAGQVWLLILVLTVWSLDSAAYLVGRSVPRGRFMNHISPNKTWSGAIGGTVAAVAVCTLLVVALRSGSPLVGVAMGLVVAVAAQTGDLAESMLKRAASAKDSGTLIPGHGGILDRVDSFLFAAPAMFTTLILLGQRGVEI